jgi:hypothetical protein
MRNHDEEQKRAESYRQRPILGTDLNRPMSEVIAEIRGNMTKLRGQIADFQFGFPTWKGRTEPVEGLLTCGIVTLYEVLNRLEAFEASQVPSVAPPDLTPATMKLGGKYNWKGQPDRLIYLWPELERQRVLAPVRENRGLAAGVV